MTYFMLPVQGTPYLSTMPRYKKWPSPKASISIARIGNLIQGTTPTVNKMSTNFQKHLTIAGSMAGASAS